MSPLGSLHELDMLTIRPRTIMRRAVAGKQHRFVKYGTDGTVTVCRGSRGSLRRTVIATAFPS